MNTPVARASATFEHWHASIKQIVTPPCPHCRAADVQRKFSAPAIRMGSGAASDAGASPPAGAGKPEIFGRKELNAALRSQGIKPAKE